MSSVSPLIADPSPLEVSRQQQRHGPVAMRLDVLGIDGNGAVVVTHRLLALIAFVEPVAAVAMGFRAVRADGDGGIVARQRLVPTLEVSKRVAAIGVGFHVRGIDRQCSIVARECRVPLLQALKRRAALLVSGREVRAERDGAAEAVDGLLRPVELT